MAAIQTILERLLVPDNAVIQQATRDLQAVYRNPDVIPGLCTLLHSSPNPQIRQFAAVLLRKRLVKLWKKLPGNDRTTIKSMLLQCLTQETVRIVFISVAHLASVLAKYELPRGQWEELSTFIFQFCHSQDPQQREVGVLLLSSVMETAALDFKQHFQSLFQLLSSALEDPQSKTVPFYALKCLTSMVEYVAEEDSPHFTPLVPKIMAVVRALISEDEDKACEGMELFDEIVECEVGMVTPHLPDLIQFSLQVASNSSLGDNLRVKALSFLQWLASLKKKSLLKQGLLPSVIRTMLTIMATPHPGGAEDEGDATTETQSPISLAAQVLDILSLHLPPEKILSPVLECVEPWLESTNHFQRAASLIAIAVMVEGCSVHIKNHHLPALLQIVYKGVRDEEKVVRNASLFAIGQFSEHLQPQIAEYSGELLPVLFQFVDHALQSPLQEASALTKIFYALETFCEQLGPKLVPYLPVLMEKLFVALSSPDVHNCIHVKELAISAIGAAANACESEFLPYFDRTINLLKQYIMLPHHQDTLILQAQAIDTLGTLARTVSEDNFRPLAAECVTLGVALLQGEDPDLRRSVYGMLASVSCVIKEEMCGQLEPVVGRIFQALVSEEGVTVHYASSEVPFLDFDEEEEEEEEGEGGERGEASSSMLDDSRAIEGYTVENAYLEEKEDGLNALAEIAGNVGPGFVRYIDDCFREANSLTEHSHEGIRKAAICAVATFCRLWYRWLREAGSTDLEELQFLTNSTVLSLAATARTDSDRNVVGASLESLENIFKSLKGTEFKLAPQACSSVLVSLQDILHNKAQCCGVEAEDSGTGDMVCPFL
ncbi:Importin-4 [Geodia barretti]|uniref:Importin-4 n=1 Tax=Geodia barretti TaxID=519541 RepID=A0AA35QV90_GEOBA|nr:Importin-4 [Geodia barretti]